MGDNTIRHKVKILYDNNKSIEYVAKEYDLSFKRVASYYEDFEYDKKLLSKVKVDKLTYIKQIESLLFIYLEKESTGLATLQDKKKSRSLQTEYIIYNALN